MRAAAALLALLVATVGLPGRARSEDYRPDLQIEIAGPSPSNPRQVVVRVTNVSDWWSEKTRATVEPVVPTPGAASRRRSWATTWPSARSARRPPRRDPR
jgi:hypothetical protein